VRHSLRRQFFFLRAYALVTSLILIVLAGAAFRQTTPQKFGEISVERINLVDADGTLRMVIANKARMHPGVMDGVTIDRPRPVAGMIFFNDQGDEVGEAGLIAVLLEEVPGLGRSRAVALDQVEELLVQPLFRRLVHSRRLLFAGFGAFV